MANRPWLTLRVLGSSAIAKRIHWPILVLLDLRLPRMSGLELLQWMRPRKHLRRIPVVILTVEKDPSYMEAAYDLGANSYLIKSPKEQDVLRLVELIQQYWIAL